MWYNKFFYLLLLLLGVAGVEKGREGWGKGRGDWGEKVPDSLSFRFLFSLPPSLPRPLYISHSGICGYCGQNIHLDFPKLQYVWYPEKLFQHITSRTYFAQIPKFFYPYRKLHVCLHSVYHTDHQTICKLSLFVT